MSNRRRHVGSRDAPESSNCVGVFGLSLYTTERELEKEFSKFGPLEKVTVVLDGKVNILFVLYTSNFIRRSLAIECSEKVSIFEKMSKFRFRDSRFVLTLWCSKSLCNSIEMFERGIS